MSVYGATSPDGIDWNAIEEPLLTDYVTDTQIVARYDEAKIAALLADARIIRNRAKIRSVVSNAQAFLQVQADCGGFAQFLWDPVDGQSRLNCFQSMEEVPAETPESRALAADLKQRGFRFVGPIICYAYMQATGMVNDHLVRCFRYRELAQSR